MYKIVAESILLFSLSLKILSRNSLDFMGIMVFIIGYENECEKSFFYKIGCTGK